jgi:hypothetical protein
LQPQQLRADREGLGPFVRQRAFQAYSAQSEPEDSVLHTSIRDAIDHYLAERPPLRDVICNNATALCRAYSTTPDCSEAFADHLDYLTIKYMMDVISSQSDHGLRRISRVGPAIELAVSPMIIVSAHYGPYLPLVGLPNSTQLSLFGPAVPVTASLNPLYRGLGKSMVYILPTLLTMPLSTSRMAGLWLCCQIHTFL